MLSWKSYGVVRDRRDSGMPNSHSGLLSNCEWNLVFLHRNWDCCLSCCYCMSKHLMGSRCSVVSGGSRIEQNASGSWYILV